MTTDVIVTIIKNIIDICLVWFLLYYVLKNIRNNAMFRILTIMKNLLHILYIFF